MFCEDDVINSYKLINKRQQLMEMQERGADVDAIIEMQKNIDRLERKEYCEKCSKKDICLNYAKRKK